MTITLRIDKDVMEELNNQADSDSISLNSVVNHALNRYVKWNKYEENSSMISICSPVVRELFDGLNEDQIITIAKNIAKDAIYNILLFTHCNLDFDTLLAWYKERMKNCAGVSDKSVDDKRTIIFKHELGLNWSLYHKTIIESICCDYFSKALQIGVTSSTIKLEIYAKEEENYLHNVSYSKKMM